jgi:hypothetical protein
MGPNNDMFWGNILVSRPNNNYLRNMRNSKLNYMFVSLSIPS